MGVDGKCVSDDPGDSPDSDDAQVSPGVERMVSAGDTQSEGGGPVPGKLMSGGGVGELSPRAERNPCISAATWGLSAQERLQFSSQAQFSSIVADGDE